MKMRTGKVEAKGVVSHAVGPVNTINDAAKFPNKGKTSGKTPANGVVNEAEGPTFTCNETHIPAMNADKPAPMSKAIKSAMDHDLNVSEHETAGDKTATKAGSAGIRGSHMADEPTDRAYPLKRSYEKGGRSDRIPNRANR